MKLVHLLFILPDRTKEPKVVGVVIELAVFDYVYQIDDDSEAIFVWRIGVQFLANVAKLSSMMLLRDYRVTFTI